MTPQISFVIFVHAAFLYHRQGFSRIRLFFIALELFDRKIEETVLRNLEFDVNGIFREGRNLNQIII